MTKRFGYIRQLPSGRFQASFVAPNGVRVKAELTFDRREEAETWLAAQRTDLARSTWRAPTVGSSSLRRYAVSWLEQRGDLRPSSAELYEQKLRLHTLPVLGDTRSGSCHRRWSGGGSRTWLTRPVP